MNYTVWKIVLKAENVQDIEVPEGAELLTAREQQNDLCVWFRCDPSKPKTKRRIAVVGTGHPAPDDGRYIGSGFFHDGGFVFHVFERGSA